MPKILVADDDPGIQRTVHRLLTDAGYEVELAPDGAVALERYRNAPSDLVLIDMAMPIHSGLEAITLFRQEFPAARLIAMSGNPFHHTMLRAAERREIATIEKPFEPEDLIALIKKTLAA